MRKRGITSPLDLLPLHQKQSLAAWLTTGGTAGDGISYAGAVKRLAQEFGVKTNTSTLCNWRQRNRRTAGLGVEKKKVVRSPLDRLPREVQCMIFGWLTAGGANGRGITYEEASACLRADLGISIGVTALSGFYRRYQGTVQTTTPISITTSEYNELKTITLQTTSRATVETTQDAATRTATVKITLPS